MASSDKDQSIAYWSELLKLKLYKQSEKQAILGYADDQAKLELQFIGEFSLCFFIYLSILFLNCQLSLMYIDQQVEHCKAFGRIAFSCPSSQLKSIECDVKAADAERILTPYISLDTPGKATVQVVIVADPVKKLNNYIK